jgi:hypothetical protein
MEEFNCIALILMHAILVFSLYIYNKVCVNNTVIIRLSKAVKHHEKNVRLVQLRT